MWFGIDDDWIGPGTQHHLAAGATSAPTSPTPSGVAASRTDVVPDGKNGALVGLSLALRI